MRSLRSFLRRGDRSRRRLTKLREEVETLRRQVDALKSSLEVPQELIDEFFDWKERHPVPEKPLVSVCVTTWNRAALLTERCIPSVLGQTWEHLEMIVVGDGCTDDTGERVARIKDPRLTFINQTERGAYPRDPERRWMVAGTHAINRARRMAKGDWVTQLDDDDEYTRDRLEKLVRFAAETAADFVWHPFWVEDASGSWAINEAPEFASGQLTNGSVFYRSWFTRIEADINAHRLLEPGDWNRYRRIRHINPVMRRHPEALLRHYREAVHRPAPAPAPSR
jgi:glycosyltransferase involved in cell wall biosynthesis